MWRTPSTLPLEECLRCCWRPRHYRIEPLSTLGCPNVEFIEVDTKRILRVVRFTPEKDGKRETAAKECESDQISHSTNKNADYISDLVNLAEILLNVAMSEALIQIYCDKFCKEEKEEEEQQEERLEGFVNAGFVSDVSLICNVNHVNECVLINSSTESSTISSNNGESLRFRRLPAKSSSTSAKPLIFFIHGLGASADVWKIQMKYFSAKGFESVAVDLIGHGFSSAPGDAKSYTFHRILSDLLLIFDRFCHETNVLVGHSYGSSFAAALSHRRTSQISHLVLMSGGGPICLRPRNRKTVGSCLLTCLQQFLTCGVYSRDLMYSPSGRQIVCCNKYEVPSRVLGHMERGQKWKEGDLAFYRRISIPTLLIHGLRDNLVTLVEECEMEKAINRSFLELIPDASHMVMLEAPERVNRLIYTFIREK